MKHLVIATLHGIALWPLTLSQNRIPGLNTMSNTHQMGHAHPLFILTWEWGVGVKIIFIKSEPIVLDFLTSSQSPHCHLVNGRRLPHYSVF